MEEKQKVFVATLNRLQRALGHILKQNKKINISVEYHRFDSFFFFVNSLIIKQNSYFFAVNKIVTNTIIQILTKLNNIPAKLV